MPKKTTVKSVSKRFDPRHREVIWMAVCGAQRPDIATQTGYSLSNVKQLLARSDIKEEITRLQDKVFEGQAKKKFASVFPEAFAVAREVMHDKNTKPGVRAAQARDFMDRHAGKPLQKTENETTLISELIVKLDDSRKTSPVEKQVTQGDNKVIDVTPEKETKELPKPQAPEIDVDSWVEQNLGE